MTGSARGHGEGEGGFTLVELVVSMTVIALGVFGVMGVMGSSFGVANTATGRTRAVALATQEIEALRALPYTELQVSDQVRTRTVQVGGARYTVQTVTSWKASGAVAQAYKQALVAVSWSDERGYHEVHQTSWFSEPGIVELGASTATSTCGGGPTEPRSLQAAATPGQETTSVDVTWQAGAASSVPVARWVVERSSDGFATAQLLDDAVPAATFTFRSTGLAPGTTYGFRLRAVSPCGSVSPWSSVVTAGTAASVAAGCTLGTPNVTPAQVPLANNSKSSPLASSPKVTIPASGSCDGFSLRFQQTSTATVTSVPMTLASGSLSASIPVGGPWDVKVHTLQVHEGASSRATLLLTVCTHAGSCS